MNIDKSTNPLQLSSDGHFLVDRRNSNERVNSSLDDLKPSSSFVALKNNFLEDPALAELSDAPKQFKIKQKCSLGQLAKEPSQKKKTLFKGKTGKKVKNLNLKPYEPVPDRVGSAKNADH